MHRVIGACNRMLCDHKKYDAANFFEKMIVVEIVEIDNDARIYRD